MRFSLYSELQLHPGKTAERLYGEVLEQMVNADRLGYDVYAVIRHPFFPKFLVPTNPTASLPPRPRRRRESASGRCCTRCRTTTRSCRRARQRHRHPDRRPLRVGVGRGHGRLPPLAGEPLDEHARPRYEEAVDLLLKALHEERFSFAGEYFQIADSHVVPFIERNTASTWRNLRPDLHACRRAWLGRCGATAPSLRRARQGLHLYRESCAEHGTEPDIVWIHACHLDDDRETAVREGRDWITKFIAGNASPLTEWPTLPADALNAAGYGFYAAGIMEGLTEIPYEKLIEDDYVWVGTPQDIIERIEATRVVCAGVQEIGITVNAGGAPHWMAIKNQELFASAVMPHFQRTGELAGVTP